MGELEWESMLFQVNALEMFRRRMLGQDHVKASADFGLVSGKNGSGVVQKYVSNISNMSLYIYIYNTK